MRNRWPFALSVVVDLDHRVVTQHGRGLDASSKYLQRINEILGDTLDGYAPAF
jgi:hypothetical protein